MLVLASRTAGLQGPIDSLFAEGTRLRELRAGLQEQLAPINGASDLLIALYGDVGRHARSATGVHGLPSNVSVEVELIVEVADHDS